MAEGKYLVRQVRSSIGETKRVHSILNALGLGRIGKEVQQDISNPAVFGMLKKVKHLVHVRQ